MLKNLIRHEFRATRRVFLPAYGVLIALAVISAIFMQISASTQRLQLPFGILIFAYIVVLCVVCVLSAVYMIVRFYKNLLCDEGYLMFTLPVTPAQLVWSKCIVAAVWILLTAILAIVTVSILISPLILINPTVADFGTVSSILQYWFSQILQQYGAHMILLPLLALVLAVVYVLNFCMHIYACLSIGGLFNTHRVAAAIVTYIVCAIVAQTAATFLSNLYTTYGENHLTNWLNFFFGESLTSVTASGMYVYLLGGIVLYAVYLLVNFIITNYILKHHLNLQ